MQTGDGGRSKKSEGRRENENKRKRMQTGDGGRSKKVVKG
jgi:hypothetical protein